MRYKTLFGLLLKAAGVLLMAEGVSYWVSQSIYVLRVIRDSSSWVDFRTFNPLIYPTLKTVIGAYLFWDGRWLVNKAFPRNRPYCPQCGEELTGVVSDRCPECGHPIEPNRVEMPASDDTPTENTESKEP